MPRKIKAHYDGKFIVPDEPLDLPKGQLLTVRLEVAKKARNGKAKSVLDWIAENAIDDDSLPTDLSYQHDHYLYGTPKKKPPRRKSPNR